MQERQINHLWDLYIVDRQVQSALRRLISNEGEHFAAVVRLLDRHIPSLTAGEIKASLRQIEVLISCSVTMEPSKPTKLKPPKNPMSQNQPLVPSGKRIAVEHQQ